MKITVKSEALQVLASTGAAFTATKGNSQVSRNARLTTAERGNTLILRATNGTVSLYMRIGARVEEPGDLLVSLDTLSGLEFTEPAIQLNTDGKSQLVLTDGTFRVRVPVAAADVFPDIAWFEGDGCEVDLKALKAHLDPLFEIVDSKVEDISGAVRLVFVKQAQNEGLLLTATDKNTIGSTMVKASVPPSLVGEATTRIAIVPARYLKTVVDKLPAEGTIKIGLKGESLQISDGISRTFTLQLMAIGYPNLGELEGRLRFTTKAVVPVTPIAKRLMGIRRVVDGKAANILILVPGAAEPATPATLHWHLGDKDGTQADDQFPVAYDGAGPIRLGVGFQYLAPILKSLDDLGVTSAEIHIGPAEEKSQGDTPVTLHPIKIAATNETHQIAFIVAVVNIAAQH
jgi:hypothetical protein